MNARSLVPELRYNLLAMYALLAVPFLLNDFSNIHITDPMTWIMVDYVVVKLLPLVLIAFWLRARKLYPTDFGIRRMSPFLFVFYALALSLGGVILDQYGYDYLAYVLPSQAWGAIPELPEGSALRTFDLLVGLLFVGIVEELIFRGLAFSALSRAGLRPWVVVVLSSLVFGLIHWSLGVAAVVCTGAIGAVFMLGYIRCKSLYPLIVAHFLVNFVYFW